MTRNYYFKKKNPMKGMTFKEKIHFAFYDIGTPIGKLVDFMIILFIFILCISYVIHTYQIPGYLSSILDFVERFIIGVFILEYILRFYAAPKKISHFFNIYSIIDLISIIPFFFTLTNLQFLRIFRVFRVFRLIRYLQDEHFFFGTIKEDKLIILRIIFTIFSIVFVSSGLFYHAEKVDGSKMESFFDAVYFTVVTLTTVGFGDITPLTQGGRIITILMIISGVIFLPWQIGSLIKKFAYTLTKKDITCQQCGLKYHDDDAVHCKACGALIYQEYESDLD